MPRLLSTVAWIVVPAVAAYLMRRYMVSDARLPLPVVPVAVVEKARSVVAAVVETPAVKRARSAASLLAVKGSWGLMGVSQRILGK